MLFDIADKIPRPIRSVGADGLLYLSRKIGRNDIEYSWKGHEFRFGYYDKPTLARITQDRFLQDDRTYEGIPLEFLDCDKSTDGILDIGGHFGIYTVFLSVINPETSVFAFEPNSYNVEVLRKNVELNNLSKDRVAVHQTVMSNESGKHTIYEDISYDGGVDHTLNPDNSQEDYSARQIKGYSASNFCEHHDISRCFAKIDAESEELNILRDIFNAEYVERIKGVVDIHPEKEGISVRKFLNLINEAGYTASEINPDYPDNNPAYVFEPAE
jgi:FkbM family methyltransferase